MPKRVKIDENEQWTAEDSRLYNELKRKMYRCKSKYREKIIDKAKQYYIKKKDTKQGDCNCEDDITISNAQTSN